MKVLVSAYACDPRGGSEPGVGWNWSRAMARHHDVWVLTRSNNREEIERALAESPQPRLRFLYLDLPRWARSWKRGQRGIRLYYYLWQVLARRHARRAHAEIGFDLVHHLTFATAFVPALTYLPGVPFVLGPVGGGIRAPWRLLFEWGPRGWVYELLRAIRRMTARYLDPLVRLTWRRAALILVQNPETLEWLPSRHRGKCRLMPNAGIDPDEIEMKDRPSAPDRVAVTAARLIHVKGASLAIRALSAVADEIPELRLVVAGRGPDRPRAERLAQALGVSDRVDFTGWLERPELLSLLAGADLLLFPSLHEECGAVVVEAMALGVVPVVLDAGGPPILTGDAGYVVPLRGASRDAVVRSLARVLRTHDPRSEERRLAALDRARSLTWDRKLEALAELLPMPSGVGG
jgi:glycosyltransferase involved in cell wall biosynthesis